MPQNSHDLFWPIYVFKTYSMYKYVMGKAVKVLTLQMYVGN